MKNGEASESQCLFVEAKRLWLGGNNIQRHVKQMKISLSKAKYIQLQ